MGLGFKRVRRSKKQQIWEFMRRNRQFRVGDLMMILEVKPQFLMNIIHSFELCGYVRLVTGSELFRDRIFLLKNDTGVRSPILNKEIIKDQNTKEVFVLDGKHPIQIADKLSFLYAMKHDQMTKKEIAHTAGFDAHSMQSIRYLREFSDQQIMICQPTHMSREGQTVFVINTEKRDDLIRTLEESLRPARSA